VIKRLRLWVAKNPNGAIKPTTRGVAGKARREHERGDGETYLAMVAIQARKARFLNAGAYREPLGERLQRAARFGQAACRV
jgi:hypothetical protein